MCSAAPDEGLPGIGHIQLRITYLDSAASAEAVARMRR